MYTSKIIKSKILFLNQQYGHRRHLCALTALEKTQLIARSRYRQQYSELSRIVTQLTKDNVSPNINHKPYISDNALEGWSIQNITWPFHRFNFSNPVLFPQKLFKIVTYNIPPLHARKCWLKPWMGEIIHFAPWWFEFQIYSHQTETVHFKANKSRAWKT